MKKIGIIALICMGLISNQCSDETVDPITLGEEFTLPEGGSVTLVIPGSSDYIALNVMEIAESRCPSDVSCVRYGEARVKVGVNGVQEVLKILDLCIGECPEREPGFVNVDTVGVELDGKEYAVLLKNVVPYPKTTNENQTKKALLEVIRL